MGECPPAAACTTHVLQKGDHACEAMDTMTLGMMLATLVLEIISKDQKDYDSSDVDVSLQAAFIADQYDKFKAKKREDDDFDEPFILDEAMVKLPDGFESEGKGKRKGKGKGKGKGAVKQRKWKKVRFGDLTEAQKKSTCEGNNKAQKGQDAQTDAVTISVSDALMRTVWITASPWGLCRCIRWWWR